MSLSTDALPPTAIYQQTGALISVVSCTIILLSFLRRRRWRRHPNALLFYKAAVDFVYALRFLFAWDAVVGPLGCRALASLTQFCMIASECWFVNMSLDLYRCSTNPFTNVQQSLRYSHAFAWGMGALFAAALWLSGLSFHTRDEPFCYVTERDTTLQLLYYAVVVLSVLAAVLLSVLEAQAYPHGGMQEALQAKQDVIRSARVFTTAYIAYQIVLISLWVADLVSRDLGSPLVETVRNVTLFLQASKGLIDLVIWVAMNGRALRRHGPSLAMPHLSRTASSTASTSTSSSSRREDRYSDINMDLEPQLNVALRKEVLHFTTRGVVAASAHARQRSRSRDHDRSRGVVRLRLHELGMVVAFADYEPSVFRDIRAGFGIDETAYRTSFLATCHERIQSGGSSGAFLFFTADYRYLVKTVTATERTVLLRMLPSYVAHMRTHARSHLTRYYGCHAIEMYGQVFSFVVMGNAIGRVSMHQFYDLKGSWINRHAQPIPPGKTVICTYCSQAFRYGSTAHCEFSIHGSHLPHVVLKDNDFHRKLRVPAETAEEIVAQLDADTAFLRAQGITDYSLLLSIHSTKYVVDQASTDIDTEALERAKRRVHHAAHAVCRPATGPGEQPRDGSTTTTTTSARAMQVNVEVVDGTDSTSSDDDDDAYPGDIQVTTPALDTSRRRGVLSRHFRYSVLTTLNDGDDDDDDGDETVSTPLLPGRPSTTAYGSTSPRAPVAVSITVASSSTEWVGTRAPDKPGYRASAVVGPDYYTIGLVDILQTWTFAKRLERAWKVWVLRHDANGISAAPPAYYAERFRRKMREIMMVPNDDVGFGHL